MTRADKIRAMDDMKLAMFMAENAGCEWCVAKVGDDCDQCGNVWLEWLRQESEE